MIYINPVGGLGNMFFHIATIWSLAKDNDSDLCLLNIDKKIEKLKSDPRSVHADEYRYIFNRFLIEDREIENSIEYPFKYVDLEYKDGYQYIGYFQCENYFKHRRLEIIDLFKPDDDINIKLNKYEHLYDNISLHVRRGDYVNLYPNIHIPQSMDYYNKSLSMLPENLKVIIFSDDIDWCKNNFIGSKYIIIDELDYISIYLMSKMKYHIIANSTFSWWGAWLSENEDKMVIAPKKWFGDINENFDINMKLIPDNWIRI